MKTTTVNPIRADLADADGSVRHLVELGKRFGQQQLEIHHLHCSVATSDYDWVQELRPEAKEIMEARKSKLSAALKPLWDRTFKRVTTLHEELPRIGKLNDTPIVSKYVEKILSFMKWEDEDRPLIEKARDEIKNGKWGEIINKENVDGLFRAHEEMLLVLNSTRMHLEKISKCSSGRPVANKLNDIPSHPTVGDGEYLFKLDGDVWLVRFEGKEKRIKHQKGFVYINYLLKHPHNEYGVLDMLKLVGGVDPGGPIDANDDSLPVQGHSTAGDYTDEKTIKDIQRERQDLKDELTEARANNDLGRISLLQDRLEKHAQYLNETTYRGRAKGESTNKASIDAVSKAIDRATVAIGKHLNKMGTHLRFIFKGTTFTYRPDKPINWS